MILYKKDFYVIFVLTVLILLILTTTSTYGDEKELIENTQSDQSDINNPVEKKDLGFTSEEIDIDTFKIIFVSNKLVNVIELQEGYFLTIVDVSNPSRVLQYVPEIGKALPINLGIKVRAYSNRALEFKAEKGEYVILKYEKPEEQKHAKKEG